MNADPSIDDIREGLRYLIEPGQPTELRALIKACRGGKTWTEIKNGFFDDMDRLANEAARLSDREEVTGVYVVPNRINPALLARRLNRVEKARQGEGTTDRDVERRTRLLIDLDPVRPTGVSSTSEEHDAALEMTERIRDYLREKGWPEGGLADSGNGAHLVFALDLPNDDASTALVKNELLALDLRFSNDTCKVDTTTFNAARIWKLYGTVARKGDSTKDRPHRVARALDGPETLVPVPVELLHELVASLPEPPPKVDRRRAHEFKEFDHEAWMREYCPDADGPVPYNGGQKWLFPVCPWNPAHDDRSAFVIRFSSGGFAARCHHNGCRGKDWTALWRLRDSDGKLPGGPGTRGRERQIKLCTVLAADVEPKPIEWLWPHWIPCGMVTLLAGDMGLGKTTMLTELIARASRGRPFPFDAAPPSGPIDVLYMTSEDPIDRVLRPKLQTAGADLQRVTLCGEARDAEDDSPQLFGIPEDLAALREQIESRNIKLVILDTLPAMLSASVEMNNDQHTRRAMLAVQKLAETTGCAILAVLHLNKKQDQSAMYRIGGSTGWIGSARSALLMAHDLAVENRRILCRLKTNFAKPNVGLAFEVVPDAVTGQLLVQVDKKAGLFDVDPDALTAKRKSAERGGKLDEAIEWLEEKLAAGPVKAKVLEEEAPCSKSTLRKAKNELGAEAKRMQGASWWILHESADAEDGEENPVEDATISHLTTLSPLMTGT